MTALAQRPAKPNEPSKDAGAIPHLENGDHLSPDEFMRRYAAMTDLKKAELIQGVVYVASPVRQRFRGRQHFHLVNWLGQYEAGTPGLEGGDNSTVRLDVGSLLQPDCTLFIQPEYGGQVKVDEEGYIAGAPDLVAEVSASSVSYDLHVKLAAYRASGVREYVVVRVLDQEVDWFVLRDGRYEKISPAEDGILRSTIFPGLWLDPSALIQGDLARILAVVQRGLSTPGHTDFAASLVRS